MGRKTTWIIVGVTAIVVALLLLRAYRQKSIAAQLIPIEGAVIRHDTDTEKQLPIANVAITASDGVNTVTTRSEASGYFRLIWKKTLLSEKPVIVSFRDPAYMPLD